MWSVELTNLRYLTSFFQAALTKFHRLGGLNKRNFSQFWRLGCMTSGWQRGTGLVRAFFLVADSVSSMSSQRWGRDTRKLLHGNINSIRKAPPSWPNLALITPQRIHFQIPSHWAFNTWKFWRNTNIHSIAIFNCSRWRLLSLPIQALLYSWFPYCWVAFEHQAKELLRV